jgi:hypothetical protein
MLLSALPARVLQLVTTVVVVAVVTVERVDTDLPGLFSFPLVPYGDTLSRALNGQFFLGLQGILIRDCVPGLNCRPQSSWATVSRNWIRSQPGKGFLRSRFAVPSMNSSKPYRQSPYSWPTTPWWFLFFQMASEAFLFSRNR